LPVESLRGERVFVMTAIGNPTAFVRTCEQLGSVIAGQRFFPDHHHFTTEEHDDVMSQAATVNATKVVVTQKDLVKLPAGSQCEAVVIAAEPQTAIRKALVGMLKKREETATARD